MYSKLKHNINILWIDFNCWELLEWWTLVQFLSQNPVVYLVLIIPFQVSFSLLLNKRLHPWIPFLFTLFKDKWCLKHLELHYLVKKPQRLSWFISSMYIWHCFFLYSKCQNVCNTFMVQVNVNIIWLTN